MGYQLHAGQEAGYGKGIKLPKPRERLTWIFHLAAIGWNNAHAVVPAHESRNSDGAAAIGFTGVPRMQASLIRDIRPENELCRLFVEHTDRNCREDSAIGLRKTSGRCGRRGRLQCPPCRESKRGYEVCAFNLKGLTAVRDRFSRCYRTLYVLCAT